MSNSKKICIIVLIVVLLCLIVFGASYAIWNKTLLGSKENTITSGVINFSYSEGSNVIMIENALPTADSRGKLQKGNRNVFDFKVEGYSGSDVASYEISTVDNAGNSFPEEYLKIYLTDQNDNPMHGFEGSITPLYTSFPKTEDNKGRILYRATLNNQVLKQYFRLRIWVSSDYEYREESRNFRFKVNVKQVM